MNGKNGFCMSCGAELPAGDDYCGQCGNKRQPDVTAQHQELEWDADIPANDLLTGVAKVMVLAVVLVLVLVEVMSLFSGRSFIAALVRGVSRGASDFGYAAGFIGFFVLLCVVIIKLIYRRGYGVTYRLTPEGAWMVTRGDTRKTNRVINGVLFWTSLFSGRPGGMGTAILADASQTGFFEWRDIHAVSADADRRIIDLRSKGRTLLKLHCTPDNYAAVLHTVHHYVKH